eukprot:SAG31_NODE_1405_length_8488_cov_2.786029_13_plen_45_part_00
MTELTSRLPENEVVRVAALRCINAMPASTLEGTLVTVVPYTVHY